MNFIEWWPDCVPARCHSPTVVSLVTRRASKHKEAAHQMLRRDLLCASLVEYSFFIWFTIWTDTTEGHLKVLPHITPAIQPLTSDINSTWGFKHLYRPQKITSKNADNKTGCCAKFHKYIEYVVEIFWKVSRAICTQWFCLFACIHVVRMILKLSY